MLCKHISGLKSCCEQTTLESTTLYFQSGKPYDLCKNKSLGQPKQFACHKTKQGQHLHLSLELPHVLTQFPVRSDSFLVKPFLYWIFEKNVLCFTNAPLQLNIYNVNNSLSDIYSSGFIITHKRACCHQNHHRSRGNNDNTTP